MYPILYEQITVGVVPQDNGLGVLSDCISCKVEQERNGRYELTMEYPASGIHAEELVLRRVLKVKPNFTDNPQLFRIDRIGKTINGKFSVYAKHISYDLSGYEITEGTAGSAVEACTLLQSKANGYTITTDKVVSATFKINTPASVKSYFVGREGSFLDVFGTAEIKYDNFNVQFLLHAGADRGVTIRYGKNLLELSQELGSANLYTHVICFYKQEGEPAVYSDKVSTELELDTPKCLLVDVSEEYESKPTKATLTARATKYKNDNNLTIPTNNITLDFAQSGELVNRVDLCDTVNVYYEALGITRAEVKCIRTVWDCIREKYIETEFGDAVTTAVDTIVATSAKVANTPSTSFMETAIAHATELITGNLGGYVVLHDSNGDGEPDEILIMDTADIDTATKVWRWNKNGLGYSSTGYSGTFGTAITADGKIVADYVATGTLNANLIKAGVISDQAGNSTINMTNGVAKMTDLSAKERFSLVDANDVKRVVVRHNNSEGSSVTILANDGSTRSELYYNTEIGTRLRLYNKSGTRVAVMSAIDSGGWLTVANSSGLFVATINANNDGGSVSLRNSSDIAVATMATGAGGNGFLSVKNASGTEVSVLDTVTYGGDISIKNSLGTRVAYIQANSAMGASLGILNAGNVITILCSGDTGNVRCVSLTQTSSRKVKKNIKPIADARKILELEAVSFDYKNEAQGTDKRGFVAEEVATVIPNLVTPETEEAPATLDYIGMIPYLQAVIKEQDKRIADLENKLADFEKRLNGLEK